MTASRRSALQILLVAGVLVVMLAGSLPFGPAALTSALRPSLNVTAPIGATPVASGVASPSTTPHPWSCHGLRLLGTSACGGPADELGPVGAGNRTAGWTEVGAVASPPPQALYDFEMAYDAADSYVLLIGATTTGGGTEGPTDLWSYANGTWEPLHPAVMPENCPGSMLSYDSHDGYVVFLGGMNFGGESSPCSAANQTWSYHGGAWSQLAPALSPPGRFDGALVDDPADGYLLLYGGESGTCTIAYGWCNDTWRFSSGSWTQLTPTVTPSPRGEAGIAYDAAAGYVLLFGGTGPTGNLNDTWNYSGGTWTPLHPAHSPPVPTPDAFSYDSSDKEVVYTTAYNFTGGQSEVAWTFSSGDWSQVASSGPIERLGAASADDPTDGRLLFFGGTGAADLADTWGFHAGNWTNLTPVTPGPRYYSNAVWDGASRQFLLFGGSADSGVTYPTNDLWAFSGDLWTQVATSTAPPARTLAGMAYDAADGYVLLFGGQDTSGMLDDTWEFAGGVWTELTPATPPPGQYYPNMVYDAADGYVVLLTGAPGHMSTWTYQAGAWSNITSTAGAPPPGPPSNPLVYDSTDGYVLLFGTSLPAINNVTWTFQGGVWSNITATAGAAPPPASASELLDYPPGGYVLLVEDSTTNNTWTFSGGTWLEQFASYGPSPIEAMAAAYDPTASAGVFYGGLSTACGPYDTCSNTWLWSNASPSAPYIRAFTADPATVDVGISTTFSVSAGGGVGPLSYAYAGLPAGCASGNVSLLPCTPTVVGIYDVAVTVTDSNHSLARAVVGLTVYMALVVASFTVAPSTLGLGGTAILRANVSGGTPPYRFSYTGLPAGCSSQTVPALPCTPTASGSYTVTVNVTDGAGATAATTASFTVNPAGASGAPSISSFGAGPAALVLGNATNFTVVATGGVGPLSYLYTGLPSGCLSSNASRLACRPTAAGTFTVWASVSDSTGGTTSVATNLTVFPVGGGAGLTVTAFGATPSFLPVNGSTILVVSATGGTGPIGYAYGGLPPGCVPENRSLLPCRPTAPGNYSIQALVFDASGHRVGVLTTLEVAPVVVTPGPAIGGFLVSPMNVTVGTPMTLLVSVAGGLAPLRYVYTGLPAGCASTDAIELRCTPTAPGNFTPVVTVTDANGRSSSATTSLTVLPAPTPGGTAPAAAANLLESPAVLAGLFGAGAATALVLAGLRQRRRARRLGRSLVLDLEISPDDPSSGGPEV